jgi:hypothetical protein
MPDKTGVITADADGQHTPKDIGRLIAAMEQTPDALILGARQFDKDVPFRSMLGNKTTRVLMRILLGLKITDTQTGLRAIPREFIPDLLEIPYNRYEFELEMLLVAQQLRMKISEITIETVYLDGNSSSHFNPLLDSAKIYFVLFRYIAASIITAIFDYIIIFPCGRFLSFGGGDSDIERRVRNPELRAGEKYGLLIQGEDCRDVPEIYPAGHNFRLSFVSDDSFLRNASEHQAAHRETYRRSHPLPCQLRDTERAYLHQEIREEKNGLG